MYGRKARQKGSSPVNFVAIRVQGPEGNGGYATVLRQRTAEPLPGELTDMQWEHIRPLVPGPKGMGRRRGDDRRVLNGILHVVRNARQWRDVPQRYGSRATCYRRFQQWQEQGAWDAIWTAFLATLEPTERRRCMRAFDLSAAGHPTGKE